MATNDKRNSYLHQPLLAFHETALLLGKRVKSRTDKLIGKSLSVSRKPIKCINKLLADALARDRIMLSFELIVNGRQAGESIF